jgi:hypothetical protein
MTLVLADIPEGSDAAWLCLSLSIVRLTELALFGLYHFRLCFDMFPIDLYLRFFFRSRPIYAHSRYAEGACRCMAYTGILNT